MKRPSPALLALAMVLSGCSSAPLGYLEGAGPAARHIASLGWGLIAISAAATLIVLALLVYAIWRPRAPETETPGRINDNAAIRWISAGTGISVIFLLAAAIWTLLTVRSVSSTSTPPGLVIDVTGHQWWWEARYHSDVPSQAFTTANEIVIPVGVPVKVNLRSSDVIHSFWVPKLAGKTDAIPGLTNITRIEADRPGLYRGQCTEFCGMEHAKMAFFVRALSADDFRTWRDRQLQAAAVEPANAGQQAFLNRCSVCHAIRGLPAGGIAGPDLSHFAGRGTIGAGALANNAKNLAYWIDHTQTVKPGSKMPELDLPADQVNAITAYLEGSQ